MSSSPGVPTQQGTARQSTEPSELQDSASPLEVWELFTAWGSVWRTRCCSSVWVSYKCVERVISINHLLHRSCQEMKFHRYIMQIQMEGAWSHGEDRRGCERSEESREEESEERRHGRSGLQDPRQPSSPPHLTGLTLPYDRLWSGLNPPCPCRITNTHKHTSRFKHLSCVLLSTFPIWLTH